MADLKISDLTQVTNLNNGDLVEVAQENAQAQTGYTSMKASMTDLGNKIANSLQFSSALLTTAKTIIGAINELLNGKQDYVADGSYTVYGIWSETYYSSSRMWIPFPKANEYTISVTGAKYRSGTSTMTDIASNLIGVASGSESDLGFLAYAELDACVGHYGQITFTVTRN